MTVQGKGPFWFGLDTGSSYSVMDEALVQELGLPIKGVFPRLGEYPINRNLVLADYSVFDNQVLSGGFISLSLANFSRFSGRKISGILGMDFIRYFALTVDYQNKTVLLSNPDKFTPPENIKSIPLFINGGRPGVVITMRAPPNDPAEMGALIDLGDSGALSLNEISAKEHGILHRPETSQERGVIKIDDGLELGWGSQIELELGSFTFPRVDMIVTNDSEVPSIGNYIWKHFRLTLNYTKKEMYLEPNGPLNRMEARYSIKLAILAEGDDYSTYKVAHLFKDSPAARAGIQEGDVIVSCDGKTKPELTFDLLNSLIISKGTHELIVERSDQKMTFKVTSQEDH